jgi:hypothetical protein
MNWGGSENDETASLNTSSTTPAGYTNAYYSTLLGTDAYTSNSFFGWTTPSVNTLASTDSTEPGDLTINLINISDINDLVDVLVYVDSSSDTDVNVDVGVDTDVDVDTQLNPDNLEEVAEQVMSDELVDAVDKILSSALDEVVGAFLANGPASMLDQILTSNLYNTVSQSGLTSQTIRSGNNLSAYASDTTDETDQFDQLQLEILFSLDEDLLTAIFDNIINLINAIDQLQSGSQIGSASSSVIRQLQTTNPIQSAQQAGTLDDVLNLLNLAGQMDSNTNVAPPDLTALVSLIASLIQSDVTDIAIPGLPVVPGSLGTPTYPSYNSGQWNSNFAVMYNYPSTFVY